MLKVNTITINKAIIHRLDNQTSTKPELSELELNLSEELISILSTHCTKGLEDQKIRYARYKDITKNIVANQSKNLFSGNADFISFSQKIATRLYGAMSNKSISAADLVVCMLTCNNETFVGLLKLDYKNHYLSDVQNVNGKKYIGLRKMENGWPEVGSRLQKAAFMLDTGNKHVEENTNSYDLIILDRQQRNKRALEENKISQFFSDDFLNSQLLDDDNTNTAGFIRGIREFTKTCAIIPLEKRSEIYESAISMVVNAEYVNVNEFARSHFKEDESSQLHYELLIQSCETHGVTRGEFSVSDKLKKAYSKNRRVELQGIKLDVNASLFTDSDKFEYTKRTNNAGEEVADIIIKGLKIIKWE
ncbi:nucleoid-associated protein [Bacillus thuringiensis]|uniref:nucleoid-associated protein n=1 Tax=Bacillus thuringiensis TaxID=1428 RepID=UPI000BFDA99D|nr:nucleoid-associated protein [Bacillus thuringiensis]PGL79867.1 hypothetical protein CN944_13580 [Bacillus thuringiensis]HDR7901769.1 nucleoid-associated protein [Bacillus cereus]